jgi:membrane protein YqaA with SNARE-associated domain
VFLTVIGLALAAFFLHDQLTFGQAGYAGLALTVIVASGGLVLPVPALATACTAGALLTPVYVGLVAGSAGALGELTGYYLGYSGRGVLEGNRLYLKMEGWMRRRGALLLFLVSLIPNPLFDVVGIAAGALRYPLWRFLGVVWVGKVMKFLIFAYACAYSVEWLTDLFRV